ncbi:hypothetical protein [Pantoea cypripedii]|uniref:Transposase n=1 Tax=Pantoea cypripedii TaxID=55209 RepID=A0A1X1EVD3_PANCY|nr:hypothetical protein [Pantoea cypripedii]MBP2198059.1 putative transposase/invertase (TIGR01784 family) [Pantoea cypripedii]ORM93907.1 hypothetical protein HA50_11310 [Pantoea cypripedii]
MTIEEQWRLESHLKGWLEGYLEGRQEATLEIARRMLAEKLALSTIIKVTGLSEDELKQHNS